MVKERIPANPQLPDSSDKRIDLYPILHQPIPLQVRSLNITPQDTMHTPLIAVRFGEYDGLHNMVWLANNDPRESWDPDEVILPGMFMYNEQSRHLLFVPNYRLPSRDAYRGWGNIYNTKETLLSMLQTLIGNGASLFQATVLDDLGARSIKNFSPGSRYTLMAIIGGIEGQFSQQTGLDSKINAFRREGPITLDQILAREFLPISLLTLKDIRR